MQRQNYIMHARAEHTHAEEWDTLGWILHFFHHKSRERHPAYPVWVPIHHPIVDRQALRSKTDCGRDN